MKPAVRGLALVLALTFAMFSAGAVVNTQDRAYAGPLTVLPVIAPALPLSVVSAGVGGGISLVSTGAALAGAGITAAATIAGNWAVTALFNWSADAPSTFGDPPPSGDPNAAAWQYGPKHGVAATVDAGPYENANGRWQVDYTRHSTHHRGFCYLSSGATSQSCGSGWTDGTGPASYIFPAGATPTHFTLCSSTTACVQTSTSTVTDETRLAAWWARERLTEPAPSGDPGTTSLTARPQRSCSDGTTVYGSAQTFTRSAGSDVPLAFPPCPSGTVGTGMAAPITRDSDGALQGDALTGETGTSTPWTPPAVPAAYPDCANYACAMTLTVTAPDGSTFTCTQAGQCVGYRDVVKQYPGIGSGAATVARTGPDGNSYQCRFGPYAVAVAECQVIPGAGLGTAAAGVDDSVCKFQLSSPWTWPHSAITCAFGISPATQARVDTTQALLADVPPFNVLPAAEGFLAPIATLGQSCPDWQVQVAGSSHGIVCGQGFTEKMHANRTLFGLAMTLAMLGPFIWRIWHAAIPVIKVQRGS